MMKILKTIILLLFVSAAFGQRSIPFQPMPLWYQMRAMYSDSTARMPALNMWYVPYNNKDSAGSIWYWTSQNAFAGKWGTVTRLFASQDWVNTAAVLNQSASDQTASFRIAGQGQINGTTVYKLFVGRPNMSTASVIGFKNNTDTIGYVGLSSVLNNDLSLNSIKGSVVMRTPDTARVLIGQLSPELSYVVGRKGKWLVGDTVINTPRVPFEIVSYQDTSIIARNKAIVGGLQVRGGDWGGIRTISANTTLTGEDNTLIVNTSGGNVTVTLPSAASVFNSNNNTGIIYQFKKTSASNTLTIQGTGGETIDGSATYSITTVNAAVSIRTNGAAWYVF